MAEMTRPSPVIMRLLEDARRTDEMLRPLVDMVNSSTFELTRQAAERARLVELPPEMLEGIASVMPLLHAAPALQAVPTTQETMDAAEQVLVDLIPATSEGIDQVSQAASEIEENSEYKEWIQQLIREIKPDQVAKFSIWGVLILVAHNLLQVADEPMTPLQSMMFQNRMVALAVIVAVASFLYSVTHK